MPGLDGVSAYVRPCSSCRHSSYQGHQARGEDLPTSWSFSPEQSRAPHHSRRLCFLPLRLPPLQGPAQRSDLCMADRTHVPTAPSLQREPGFETSLCYSPAMWPWAGQTLGASVISSVNWG